MKMSSVTAEHNTDSHHLTSSSSSSSSSSSLAMAVDSQTQLIPLPGPNIETGSTIDKIASSSSPSATVTDEVSLC